MAFKIGNHYIDGRTVLAPMAGISDLPFRRLCKAYGAALAVSEMVTSDTKLWNSRKSASRLNHNGETGVKSVQIAGTCPIALAEAAVANEQLGADIIDINMGCPAKKVCNKAAGSALLRDEPLVEKILTAVVGSVKIPVTLKIRTGWDKTQRNALTIAQMAESIGVQALTIHGRTRACRFNGEAEYDTIAEVCQAVSIPVIANGDITNAVKAKEVLDHTGAAAIMIGRAAQGRPWIFREIDHYLKTGNAVSEPSSDEIKTILISHLKELHSFYGDYLGVRIARKHAGWYLKGFTNGENLRTTFNQLVSAQKQIECIEENFSALIRDGEKAA